MYYCRSARASARASEQEPSERAGVRAGVRASEQAERPSARARRRSEQRCTRHAAKQRQGCTIDKAPRRNRSNVRAQTRQPPSEAGERHVSSILGLIKLIHRLSTALDKRDYLGCDIPARGVLSRMTAAPPPVLIAFECFQHQKLHGVDTLQCLLVELCGADERRGEVFLHRGIERVQVACHGGCVCPASTDRPRGPRQTSALPACPARTVTSEGACAAAEDSPTSGIQALEGSDDHDASAGTDTAHAHTRALLAHHRWLVPRAQRRGCPGPPCSGIESAVVSTPADLRSRC